MHKYCIKDVSDMSQWCSKLLWLKFVYKLVHKGSNIIYVLSYAEGLIPIY